MYFASKDNKERVKHRKNLHISYRRMQQIIFLWTICIVEIIKEKAKDTGIAASSNSEKNARIK